ncbi:MAG: hypothetical protein IIC20_08590 [Chloroflexi bacterium]|nr:hypothetical protein [Chloroflexota bacterium]
MKQRDDPVPQAHDLLPSDGIDLGLVQPDELPHVDDGDGKVRRAKSYQDGLERGERQGQPQPDGGTGSNLRLHADEAVDGLDVGLDDIHPDAAA